MTILPAPGSWHVYVPLYAVRPSTPRPCKQHIAEMHSLLAAAFLALVAAVAAKPVVGRELDARQTDASPTVVTVTSTWIFPIYTTTNYVPVTLSCTQPVFAAVSGTAVPPAAGTAGLAALPEFAREDATPTSSAPAPPVATPAPAPGTSVAWVLTSSTHAEALTVTYYPCAATLAYAYTVDASTTVTYTVNSYDATATTVSTIACPWLGGGLGFGGLPSSGNAAPTPEAIVARQNTPTATGPAPIPTAATGLIGTTTVHLTHTAYVPATASASGTTTLLSYQCSASAAAPAAT